MPIFASMVKTGALPNMLGKCEVQDMVATMSFMGMG